MLGKNAPTAAQPTLGLRALLWSATVALLVAANSLVPVDIARATDTHSDPAAGPVEDVSEPGDLFGRQSATGDFNGDGWDDLAIGVPYEDVGSVADAGAVNVIFGSANGLSTDAEQADQFWHQGSSGVEDDLEAGDRFGWSVAAADFDRDGYSDLAIGVPYEDVGSVVDAGAVNVLHGSFLGLTSSYDQLWHQNVADVADASEASDNFGYSLAAGQIGGYTGADLGIGVYREDVGQVANAGAVNVLYAGVTKLTATGNQFWHQDVSGVEDVAEPNDYFGLAMAIGDFDGDAYGDLAVSAPIEDVGSAADAGAVNALYGTFSGLTSSFDQVWHQDSPGVEDAAEAADWFGSMLAAGDFDGDESDDLAIGAYLENVGSIADAGSVNIIYGGDFDTGLGATEGRPDQLLHQNSTSVPDTAEAGDRFGADIAAGDFDTTSTSAEDDLAVGAYGEDLGSVADAGGVYAIYGSSQYGLNPSSHHEHVFWTQDFPNVEDVSEAGDQFGVDLAIGSFNAPYGGHASDDLAIGIAGEDVGAATDAGAVGVLHGQGFYGLSACCLTQDQFWHQSG